MEVTWPAEKGESRCPRCSAVLPAESQGCNSCGYTLIGVSLYNPKHFVWLAFLLSAMVPIYLAASNWGKIGMTRTKHLWLGLGFLGFVLLFTVLALLPDTGSAGGRLMGYIINLPVGYLLRDMQRPLYHSAVRLGSQPGPLFKGCVFGLGFVLCAMAVAFVGVTAKYHFEFQHGRELLAQDKYEEAATVFENILREDPNDDSAVFNLALCHVFMEQWAEAAQGFEQYLRRNDKNPAAYALLAHVRNAQGRHPEADSLAAKARALEPSIFEKLFGSEASPETETKRVP